MARLLVASVILVLLPGLAGPESAQSLPPGTGVKVPGKFTTRVSVASSGAEGNGLSWSPKITPDGRFVAFGSDASNLVPGDTNGLLDAFVHDRVSGTTELVSVASDGTQSNDRAFPQSISDDGGFVVLVSRASNLVPGDTNSSDDVFVHDRVTGLTERVSLASSGAQGNYHSYHGSISADGRYVAFESGASNLVPGDTNTSDDIFVHDRASGTTTRVSVSSAGVEGDGTSQAERISADGRYVFFQSSATNLVPNDTNASVDVFVHDTKTGITERVSVDSFGGQANSHCYYPSISANGRHVGFASYASNLVPGDTNDESDVFVHDLATGLTTRASVGTTGVEGNGEAEYFSLSPHGRSVAFGSSSSNLVPGDTNGRGDIFVHDRATGSARRVNLTWTGAQSEGELYIYGGPTISSMGRFVAFHTYAGDLVPG